MHFIKCVSFSVFSILWLQAVQIPEGQGGQERRKEEIEAAQKEEVERRHCRKERTGEGGADTRGTEKKKQIER